MAKKAAMAAMSQTSSFEKPSFASAAMSASSTWCDSSATYMAKSSIARCRAVMSALRWLIAT